MVEISVSVREHAYARSSSANEVCRFSSQAEAVHRVTLTGLSTRQWKEVQGLGQDRLFALTLDEVEEEEEEANEEEDVGREEKSRDRGDEEEEEDDVETV